MAPPWVDNRAPWLSRVALMLPRAHKDQHRCSVTSRKPLQRGINTPAARDSHTAASATPSGHAAHGAGPWLHCSRYTAACQGRRRPPPPLATPPLLRIQRPPERPLTNHDVVFATSRGRNRSRRGCRSPWAPTHVPRQRPRVGVAAAAATRRSRPRGVGSGRRPPTRTPQRTLPRGGSCRRST
jgi:hypothetical protein